MEQIQSLVDRITNVSWDISLGTGDSSSSDSPVYKCVYCGCTTETKRGGCQECQSDWFVSCMGAVDSDTGFTCKQCTATVDYRHERCPECGSTRFGGVP